MKVFEGRSTLIRLPREHAWKVERYIKQSSYSGNSVSEIVERLVYFNTVNDFLPSYANMEREKVYINQSVYREFLVKAKKQGYKNGLECLKHMIDMEEADARQYGNDKIPKENPWAVEIGGNHKNLARKRGVLIVGDSNDNKNKLTNYIVSQLVKKNKGNETDLYEIKGENCVHKTKNSPFEVENSIETLEFLDWLELLVEKRMNFLNEEGYTYRSTNIPGYGLNMNLPHAFSRIFIVMDSDELTEEIIKRLNNICRVDNEIDNFKLGGLNIHFIVKASREGMYDVVDGKAKISFLDNITAILETDGQDIEEGEELGVTWNISGREVVNVKGLFY